MIDLRKSDHAYFFGFILADGHLSADTRNRGRLTIELQSCDRYILERFANLFPVKSSLTTRTRDTNFKAHYESVVWRVFDAQFREELIDPGMPIGKKSLALTIPELPYDRASFFRGIVDADGSLGLTGQGFPFVSLVTQSESLAKAYLAFIQSITQLTKTASRNRRDGVFNIAVFKEGAQALIETMYGDSCLAIPRKAGAAREVLLWNRPSTMKRIEGRRRWTHEEDVLVLSLPPEEASRLLRRTVQSVKMRRWRLSLK